MPSLLSRDGIITPSYGRIVFALLHALRIQDDAYPNDLEPLIVAAIAGDVQPLEAYCATVTAIAAPRRIFDPLRDQLQPLLDAYLTEHQKEARQRYEDYIRKHGRT